jgi:hypothetical protein
MDESDPASHSIHRMQPICCSATGEEHLLSREQILSGQEDLTNLKFLINRQNRMVAASLLLV